VGAGVRDDRNPGGSPFQVLADASGECWSPAARTGHAGREVRGLDRAQLWASTPLSGVSTASPSTRAAMRSSRPGPSWARLTSTPPRSPARMDRC
jgi:hypothetical protein